ncbi:hypothetical protein V5O48_016316 [Marasmius crinis-equi]|uniref:Uncharacterized protein n=1 Tax=Marasmius crinis-equi TaxID=585013 RepID=A0ABR3ES72_9AGAR
MLQSVACSEFDLEGLFGNSFSSAHDIQSVSFAFKGCVQPIKPLLRFFPWESIQHLDLEHDMEETLEAAFEAVKSGTSLRSLVYKGYAFSDEEPPLPYKSNHRPHNDKYIKSDIHTLTFDMEGVQGLYGIVHDFLGTTLPCLASLVVSCSPPPSNKPTLTRDEIKHLWPREVINQCFERSGCTLTTLTLSGLLLSDTDIAYILQSTPSIHTLTLSEFRRFKKTAEFPKTIT